MKPIDLEHVSPEQLKAFDQAREPTPEERARIIRTIEAELAAEGLDRLEMWQPAEPMEELLVELEDEQMHWDEQHP
jgi:hypothetical protein